MLAWGSALGLLAFLLILGGADSAHAGTFNPIIEITITDPTGGANSDFVADITIPAGDVNFAGIVAFIPNEWGVVPGKDIPVGTEIGGLTSTAVLGLINGACDNVLPVEFTMLNASLDTTDTVPYDDENENFHNDTFDDLDGDFPPKDGMFARAVEQYPDFINRIIEGGPTPIRRAAGVTVVAGVDVLLQFVIFEPGTFINKNIPDDEELGYPSVTFLQNAGDPDLEPVPGTITDFCSPLETSNITLGTANPCGGAVNDDPDDDEALNDGCPAIGTSEAEAVPIDGGDPCANETDDDRNEDFDSSRTATGEGEERINDGCPQVGDTSESDISIPLFVNPAEGTYTFTTVAVGQRDTDGDGFENSLDTCQLDVNLGSPRIKGDGDTDEDGLDAVCDPNDDPLTGGTNSDEDLDGYLNRQDNCATIANGENEADIPGVGNQLDSDVDEDGDDAKDQIGDACDPNPDSPDGDLIIQVLSEDISITGGTAPPPKGDGDEGDEDGGGSSTALIVIIVVVVGVVVVGGGAFLLTRRGRGGGTPA